MLQLARHAGNGLCRWSNTYTDELHRLCSCQFCLIHCLLHRFACLQLAGDVQHSCYIGTVPADCTKTQQLCKACPEWQGIFTVVLTLVGCACRHHCWTLYASPRLQQGRLEASRRLLAPTLLGWIQRVTSRRSPSWTHQAMRYCCHNTFVCCCQAKICMPCHIMHGYREM